MEKEGKIFLRSKSETHPSDSTSPHSASTPFLTDRQRCEETHSIYLGYASKLLGVKVQQVLQTIKRKRRVGSRKIAFSGKYLHHI